MLLEPTSIPTRTFYALSTTIMTSPWATTWQRIYRQSFWLSDGQRDIQRIAELLHKPEALVRKAVADLMVSGYLDIRNEGETIAMNAALLKQSFDLVVPRKAEFAHSFYERLFSYYPATRPLFARTDMRRQEGSLMAMLAVVVAGVERGENLVPTLQELGRKHQQRYGVVADHYPLVGGVLLETFHEYLGPAFTQEVQDAWSQAFDIISSQMLVGAEEKLA